MPLSLKKELKAFIDNIPAAKLENFPGNAGTLYRDANFRLDMQGHTGTAHNLQIQANNGAPNTSVRKAAPKSVATVIRNDNSNTTAEDVRQAFQTSAAAGGTIQRI